MVYQKYGVQLPYTAQEVYDLEEANVNTLWHDALNKEMEKLKVASDIMPDGKKPPVHYCKASGYMIFYGRMTLEQKATEVKNGQKHSQPYWLTFAGVVSREIIRISLTCSSLNDLTFLGADIQNAYMQTP